MAGLPVPAARMTAEAEAVLHLALPTPSPIDPGALAAAVAAATAAGGAVLLGTRAGARRRRRYVRLRVLPYRTDRATSEAVTSMFETLHRLVVNRWWRRLFTGQPSVALELHVARSSRGPVEAWLAICCPMAVESVLPAALRKAYPNARLVSCDAVPGVGLQLLRLKQHDRFPRRLRVRPDGGPWEPPVADRLLRLMAALEGSHTVQVALTPTPGWLERWGIGRNAKTVSAKDNPRPREVRVGAPAGARAQDGADAPLQALFYADIRILAPSRHACERIAAELRTPGAANQLVERGTGLRHGLARVYGRRLRRGEGNPIPSWSRGVYAAEEVARLWQLPSVGFSSVPFERCAVPVVPAPPGILRPATGAGLLHDDFGPVTLHPSVRWQNVGVPGAVGQGKSSFLAASVGEDLRRARCAVIVLDPKGDVADAAISLVPEERCCTLLDLARPTCGFNPLRVDAPVDAIADSVVGAVRHLFSESDIRASSDRYLRNAIVAALAHDRAATLWDAARLLSVTDEGQAYRRRVGAHVRELPEYKEIADFFGDELPSQLHDARSTTTAKLDAPANKLARLLNSPSIKRVLRNRSLVIDFDRIIAGAEVLVVRGALGQMGTGNTAVVMQLLVGMLDAALARQQDLLPARERVTVALKIDEAPLVINRGFAGTLALKRSAGLETVACWQTDAQWEEPAVREQLDALFAHRVYFATSAAAEARASAGLMMTEYADQVRPGTVDGGALGHPDVRLYLPRHIAVVSWTTPQGRQAPFVGHTLPLVLDPVRIRHHAAAQLARGGRALEGLDQPHWDPEAGRHRRIWGTETRVSVPAGEPVAESYGELIALDGAVAVRRNVTPAGRSLAAPDARDRALLAWMAELGHVLTTHVHRRWHPSRNATSAQRQLKRLWEGGWVTRMQFHRADGGGVPMAYAVTPDALRMLAVEDARASSHRGSDSDPAAGGIRALRRDVHVAAWVLAAERSLGWPAAELRGRPRSLQRPAGRGEAGASMLGRPDDLRLPGGRRAHGFLHRLPDGRRVEVEAFEAVRPDATLILTLATAAGPWPVDLLVEFESGDDPWRGAAKLERYDHMISGWCLGRRRYREYGPPLVVFVCPSERTAQDLCRRADDLLTACWAYAGEAPARWPYPGRGQILFAAERAVHEGSLAAYGLPPEPPAVRAAAEPLAPGASDPAGSASVAQPREIVAHELRPHAAVTP